MLTDVRRGGGVSPRCHPDRRPVHRRYLLEADRQVGPLGQAGERRPPIGQGGHLHQGIGDAGVNVIEHACGHGHAVPEQAGHPAQRHRIEPGEQGTQECRRPAASGRQPVGEQAGELAGAPAELPQHDRLPGSDLHGHGVVRRLDVADEGEADPLADRGPDDQQDVVVDPQLDRFVPAHGGEHGGEHRRIPQRSRGGRGVVGPAAAELRQQLGPHHAEPGQLDHGPFGQGDLHGERLGLTDGSDPGERDAQHVTC